MKEEGGSGVVGGGEISAAAAALDQGPPTPTRKADDEETPKPTGKIEEVGGGGAPISVDPDPEEAGRRRRSWREIACGRPQLGGGAFSLSTWKSAMKNLKMDFMVRAGKFFPLFYVFLTLEDFRGDYWGKDQMGPFVKERKRRKGKPGRNV